jgi:hypothetical protein
MKIKYSLAIIQHTECAILIKLSAKTKLYMAYILSI